MKALILTTETLRHLGTSYSDREPGGSNVAGSCNCTGCIFSKTRRDADEKIPEALTQDQISLGIFQTLDRFLERSQKYVGSNAYAMAIRNEANPEFPEG